MAEAQRTEVMKLAKDWWAEDQPFLLEWLERTLDKTPMREGQTADEYVYEHGIASEDPAISSVFMHLQSEDAEDGSGFPPAAVEDGHWGEEQPPVSPAASFSPRHYSPEVLDRFGSPVPDDGSKLLSSSTSAEPVAPYNPSPPDTSAAAPAARSPTFNAPVSATMSCLPASSASAAPPAPMPAEATVAPPPLSLSAPPPTSSSPSSSSASASKLAPTASIPTPTASRPLPTAASTSAISYPPTAVPSRLQTNAVAGPSGANSVASSSSSYVSGTLTAFDEGEFESHVRPLLSQTRSYVATPGKIISIMHPRRFTTPASQKKVLLKSLLDQVQKESKFWWTWSEYEDGIELLEDWLNAAIAQPGTPEAVSGEGTAELVLDTLYRLPWDMPALRRFARLVKTINRVHENAQGRCSSRALRFASLLLDEFQRERDKDAASKAPKNTSVDKKRKAEEAAAREVPKKTKPSSPVRPSAVVKPPTPNGAHPKPLPSFTKVSASKTTTAAPGSSAKPSATPASSSSSKPSSSSSSKPPSSSSVKPPAPASSRPSTTPSTANAVRKMSLTKDMPAPKQPTSTGASTAQSSFMKKPSVKLPTFTKRAAPTSSPSSSVLNPFESALSLKAGITSAPSMAPLRPDVKRKPELIEPPKKKKKVSFAADDVLQDVREFRWQSPDPEDRDNVHPRPSGHVLDLHSLDAHEGHALHKLLSEEIDWYPPVPIVIVESAQYEGTLAAEEEERNRQAAPSPNVPDMDAPSCPSEVGVRRVVENDKTILFAMNRMDDEGEEAAAAAEEHQQAATSIIQGVYNPNLANTLDEGQLQRLMASLPSVVAPAPSPAGYPAPPAAQPAPPAYQPPAHAPSLPPHQPPPHMQQGYVAPQSTYTPPHHAGYSPLPPQSAPAAYAYPNNQHYNSQQPPPPLAASHGQFVYPTQQVPPTPWGQNAQSFHSTFEEPDSTYAAYPPVNPGFQPPPPTYSTHDAFQHSGRGGWQGGRGRGRGGVERGGRGRGRGGGW